MAALMRVKCGGPQESIFVGPRTMSVCYEGIRNNKNLALTREFYSNNVQCYTAEFFWAPGTCSNTLSVELSRMFIKMGATTLWRDIDINFKATSLAFGRRLESPWNKLSSIKREGFLQTGLENWDVTIFTLAVHIDHVT